MARGKSPYLADGYIYPPLLAILLSPLALVNFATSTAGGFEIPWGPIQAATVIVTVPLIVLTLIFQRRILAGLTAGAVKG